MHLYQGGAGPSILFIHGFLGSAFSWRNQLAAAAAEGFSVVAPDLPGFGESDASWESDHSHIGFAANCAELIRRLGGGAVHVVGHSMGGKVAAWLTVRHPDLVAGLTLVDPSVYGAPLKVLSWLPGAPNLACWLLQRRWSQEERFRRDLARFYGRPVEEEVAADYWRRYRRTANQRGAVAHMRDAGGPSVIPHLGSIKVPVQVVWGEQDKVFPVSQAHMLAQSLSTVPGGPVVTVLPGADHFPMEHVPEAFNRVLFGFLKEQRASLQVG